MGIFDALNTSVAGLQAQSFALQNISGNVANSETTGYKETNTSLSGSGLRRHGSANDCERCHCKLGGYQFGARDHSKYPGLDRHGDQR